MDFGVNGAGYEPVVRTVRDQRGKCHLEIAINDNWHEA
jgi:hypothetical protein